MARDLNAALDDYGTGWAPAWSPEPGEQLIGTVLRYSEGQTDFGRSWIAVVRPENGDEDVSIWLSHTVLKRVFAEKRPKVGERIGVRRLEDVDRDGGGYRMYSLVVDREDDDGVPADLAVPPEALDPDLSPAGDVSDQGPDPWDGWEPQVEVRRE